MNSLFKFYSKRTLMLLCIGIAFTLLFTYTQYSNYNSEYEYNIWSISSFVDNYASACFLINTALVFMLTYIFNMYRNQKTGIFIRQLPVKYNNDFIAKVVLTVLLVILLVFFEIIIFNLLTKSYITNEYNKIINSPELVNTVQQSLKSIYTNYYISFVQYTIITIFLASSGMFFISIIGITLFALFMPFILLFSYIGCIIGFSYFTVNINMDIYFLNILRDYFNIVFGSRDTSNYYIILSIISIVLYIIAFFCNKYINYSKIGQLFIFRPVRYIAYIIGSIFGGFSFYYIAFNMIQPMTVLSNFVTLLISIIIAFIVIRKVEKIFI